MSWCVQEVLDFQVDKQARLNQLPATVSLRQHQLALLDNNPGAGSSAAAAAVAGGSALQGRDLSSALVFSSNALERLKQRMQVGWTWAPGRWGGGLHAFCTYKCHRALPAIGTWKGAAPGAAVR